MKTIVNPPLVFHEGNMVIYTNTTPHGLKEPYAVSLPVSPETYPNRHFMLNPLRLDYPDGTYEVLQKGAVWPTPKARGFKEWTTSAVNGANPTTFLCLVPASNADLRYDELVKVEAGRTYGLKVGTVFMVVGDDYEVNGVRYTSDNVFVLRTASAVIKANNVLSVTAATAVQVEYQMAPVTTQVS